jgi:hypothetical protein
MVVPSPKSQAQPDIGTADVDISVKLTLSGTAPFAGVNVNFATGVDEAPTETALV